MSENDLSPVGVLNGFSGRLRGFAIMLGQEADQLFHEAWLRTTNHFPPTYTDGLLTTCSGGKGSRWAEPTTFRDLESLQWHVCLDPISLDCVQYPTTILAAERPGFMGIESLRGLSRGVRLLVVKERELFDNSRNEALRLVLPGAVAKTPARFTLVVLRAVEDNPKLGYIIHSFHIGRLFHDSSCRFPYDPLKEFKADDHVTASRAMDIGLRWYSVGHSRLGEMPIGRPDLPLSEYQAVVRGIAHVESSSIVRVLASNEKAAGELALQIARQRKLKWDIVLDEKSVPRWDGEAQVTTAEDVHLITSAEDRDPKLPPSWDMIAGPILSSEQQQLITEGSDANAGIDTQDRSIPIESDK